MLSASYAGMASSMAVMGACLASPALAGTPLLTAITLLGTVAYVFAFSCGSGPVPSLLVPGIVPGGTAGQGRQRRDAVALGLERRGGRRVPAARHEVLDPDRYMGFAAVAALSGLFAKFGVEETSK